ncbi:NADPH oxidase [Dermacentor variabilis]|uniref:NADPH oxidase n=1 Tax=Dermacentor variabilis TaxID=34621 RepID=UPI003F5B99C7
MDIIARLPEAESPTGLTFENLSQLERVFREAVGPGQELNREQFRQIVQSRNAFFAERMFQLFDTDKSGTISLDEFIAAMKRFAKKSQDDKLTILFQLYDVDGDGLIQPQELRDVMRACMEENGLQFTEYELDELTNVLFEDADRDETGSVTLDELRCQLQSRPGLYENLTVSVERWLLPPSSRRSGKPTLTSRWPKKLTRIYVRNNAVSVAFCFFFFALQLMVFLSRMEAESMKHRDLRESIDRYWFQVLTWQMGALAGLNHSGDSHYFDTQDGAEVEWMPDAPTMGLHSKYELVAREFGQLLNFVCAFTALPVLRHCVTWLRSHGAGRFLPLDSSIYYHKLTGWCIFVYSVLHTVAHVLNFVRLSKGDCHMLALYLFTTHHDIGWVGGTASLTGWVLLVVLTVMVVCSLPCLRRSGRFEVFYFTHLLYTVFWFVLVLHAPNFWKWFLVPGLLLAMEMLARACRFFSSYGMTTVLKGVILPSKVIHLVLKKPPDFDYHPGDYIYLNIPCLARFEWHPFTISSAPEKDDVIWLHIRSFGGWTNHLYQYFDNFRREASELPPSGRVSASDLRLHSLDGIEGAYLDKNRLRDSESVVLMPRGTQPRDSCAFLDAGHELQAIVGRGLETGARYADYTSLIIARNPLTVRIDGPYGSPSSHIFQAQHAVLVAAGIGVTPFASILQSIMYRYYQARSTCPQCSHCWVEKLPSSVMKLRKVDFIWINRSQQSLEWFVRLLSDLEAEQALLGDVLERFLDVHIYITSALSRTDMKAVGLQLALDLLHEKDKRCLISGLKSRTQPGRPDWEKVFQGIKEQKKGKVTVFYCGPPALSQILHDHCNRHQFAFRKEVF